MDKRIDLRNLMRNFSCTFDDVYIDEDFLKKQYIKKIKYKILRLFIFCYLYEQHENIQGVV